jgi:hypothetical protein
VDLPAIAAAAAGDAVAEAVPLIGIAILSPGVELARSVYNYTLAPVEDERISEAPQVPEPYLGGRCTCRSRRRVPEPFPRRHTGSQARALDTNCRRSRTAAPGGSHHGLRRPAKLPWILLATLSFSFGVNSAAGSFGLSFGLAMNGAKTSTAQRRWVRQTRRCCQRQWKERGW